MPYHVFGSRCGAASRIAQLALGVLSLGDGRQHVLLAIGAALGGFQFADAFLHRGAFFGGEAR